MYDRKLNTGENTIKRSKKICSLVLITILLLLASSTPLSASPLEEKRKQASDLKSQVTQVDSALSNAVQDYEDAYAELTQINMAIQQNLIKLEATKQELNRCRNILNERVNSIYRGKNVEFISVILGARNFDNFLSRVNYLRKICEEDARVLRNVEELKKITERHDAELAENKAKQRVLLNKLDADKTSLEKALKQKQELLSSVNNEIEALEEERRREEERKKALERASKNGGSNTSTSSFIPDSSFTFPAAQPYSYCDSWHAPRVGHLHQGCDIFALRGTPALACVNGVILRLSTGRLGGIGVTLQDKNGNTYYYGHLDGYASGVYEGMPVSAGQMIGFVGDTGNAKGTPPHVHFEIHPGGGSAINPYPVLRLVG